MARNSLRNRLENTGLTFRTLEAGNQGGFVLRVMDRTTSPRKVTTLVQQPGQDTTTTESHIFSRNKIHPVGGGEPRFAPPKPVEPENLDRIVELLQTNPHPLAAIALQHLDITPPTITE